MSVLCVIPARGGSKGIPRKNLQTIHGKTLIEHAYLLARESNVFDEIILSTDDLEIAVHARDVGLNAPFLRPAFLANDNATSPDVLRHAIDSLRSEGTSFDYAVLMEVTSPLRHVSDVRNFVLQLCRSTHGCGVVSVAPSRDHPAQAFISDPSTSLLSPFNESLQSMVRRQDLQPCVHPFGGMYGVVVPKFMEGGDFYPIGVEAFSLAEHQALEIDTQADLVAARAFFDFFGFGVDYL